MLMTHWYPTVTAGSEYKFAGCVLIPGGCSSIQSRLVDGNTLEITYQWPSQFLEAELLCKPFITHKGLTSSYPGIIALNGEIATLTGAARQPAPIMHGKITVPLPYAVQDSQIEIMQCEADSSPFVRWIYFEGYAGQQHKWLNVVSCPAEKGSR